MQEGKKEVASSVALVSEELALTLGVGKQRAERVSKEEAGSSRLCQCACLGMHTDAEAQGRNEGGTDRMPA